MKPQFNGAGQICGSNHESAPLPQAPDRSRSADRPHLGPCPPREVDPPRPHLDPPHLVGPPAPSPPRPAREKPTRPAHIPPLHIWWPRRPLAACRAVVCAALWPDPADPLCPPAFRTAAADHLRAFAKRVNPDRISGEEKTL